MAKEMMEWIHNQNSITILVTVMVTLTITATAAHMVGQHNRRKNRAKIADMIPTSILGLLALILGFTFSMVIDRFETRRRLVVDESNSIYTAYSRVKLLAKVQGEDIDKYYQRYIDIRIRLYEIAWDGQEAADLVKEIDEVELKIWNQLHKTLKLDNPPIQTTYVFALNNMLDAADTRTFALIKRIPFTIYLLTLFISISAIWSLCYNIGYENLGTHNQPILLILIFSVILAFIHDLDHPRRGLITISQDSMIQTKEKMKLLAD